MTKRSLTTQPSFKSSKKQQHTHQFNSLIKVLKPKVFITSSSNFKTLVQELTGNGSHSPVPPTTIHVVSPEPTQVIHIDDDQHDSPDPSHDYSFDPSLECSPDPSLDRSLDCNHDPSLDNMFSSFDYGNCLSEELGSLQWSEDLDNMFMDYASRESELRDIESWLLDIEPSACVRDEPLMPLDSYEYDHDLSFMI
ncbi:hypothetical protein SSX86_017744 [Deinandra increscens subsp. villosa]|uniref:VQ domain-containing protein n=1 Tax=Deinandra increscens subsp. villosa TaxID=3103831 RepID=A0AAP0D139_9ASTR